MSTPHGGATNIRYMTGTEAREEAEREATAKSGNRNVEMYDWEVRRMEQAVPMASVRQLIQDVRRLYMELRNTQPENSDNELRIKIMETEQRYKHMGDEKEGTHHVLFNKITNRDTPHEHLKVIVEMVAMRERHEKPAVTMDAATAEVSAYFGSRVKDVHERFPVKEPELFHVDGGGAE
jgi:hypothetical protein